jgi:ribosomal protein S18 acetylase RimI-like enzyme
VTPAVGELELRTASSVSDEDLAALFTAAYEGYLVPFNVDVDGLRLLTAAFDIDREASRVALRNGELVGLANLAVRGPDAWIGGVGVVPAERRRGTGRALMDAVHDQARARDVEHVWLEVIVENTGAVALYEQLDYAHVRDVEVWSVPGGGAPVATTSDRSEAQAWIREHRTEREPWQRADASLEKVVDAVGLAVDGAAAIVRVAGGRVSVLQLAGELEPLTVLLSAARTLGDPLGMLNLPVGHPAAAALESLGGRVDIRQHEMMLTL